MVMMFLFSLSLLLMLAAVLAVLRARKEEQIVKVQERLERIAFLGMEATHPLQGDGGLMASLARWLNRVGFQIQPAKALLLAIGVVLSGVLVFKNWGLLAAVLWWGVTGLFAILIPQVRYQQKIDKLVGQIPLFIDQVIRGLVTGRNVEGAIKLATEDLQEPLKGLMDRAQKNVALGADLGEALRDAANFYDVKELHMLALAIHTSRVYGGSPREMLESVVSFIRQREQIQRELRAMTGETRVSAWVLGLMPITIVGYMIWTNPVYITAMWHDTSGQNIMLFAASLQAVGGIVLWRMIKSI